MIPAGRKGTKQAGLTDRRGEVSGLLGGRVRWDQRYRRVSALEYRDLGSACV